MTESRPTEDSSTTESSGTTEDTRISEGIITTETIGTTVGSPLPEGSYIANDVTESSGNATESTIATFPTPANNTTFTITDTTSTGDTLYVIILSHFILCCLIYFTSVQILVCKISQLKKFIHSYNFCLA